MKSMPLPPLHCMLWSPSSVGWSQESWTTESRCAAAVGGGGGGALLLVAAVGGGGGGACCLHERHFFSQIAQVAGLHPLHEELAWTCMPIVPVEHCEERSLGFKLSDLEPGLLSRQAIAVPPLLSTIGSPHWPAGAF